MVTIDDEPPLCCIPTLICFKFVEMYHKMFSMTLSYLYIKTNINKSNHNGLEAFSGGVAEWSSIYKGEQIY